MAFNTDPKSKADVLDRLTRIDFSGDIRDLFQDRAVVLKRLSGHRLRLTSATTGDTFDLTVHKPREMARDRTAERLSARIRHKREAGVRQRTAEKAAHPAASRATEAETAPPPTPGRSRRGAHGESTERAA